MKRLLNCFASDIRDMSKEEMLESIAASEGRIICAETTLNSEKSPLEIISDAEAKSAFGADMLLYNWLDVYNPSIPCITVENPEDSIRRVKELTGRIVGANLEPVDPDVDLMGELNPIAAGRQANVNTARQAVKIGLDFILLTGNPGSGVTNRQIVKTLKEIKKECGDELILMAGKMHAAGSVRDAGENIISKELIHEFVSAGADAICLPAPGTVPGITLDYVKEMIQYIHSLKALAMTAIGTSQEGADVETIKRIGLMCKMCGADIHHFGDANFGNNENIYHYGFAIRGVRHTVISMAKSPNR